MATSCCLWNEPVMVIFLVCSSYGDGSHAEEKVVKSIPLDQLHRIGTMYLLTMYTSVSK